MSISVTCPKSFRWSELVGQQGSQSPEMIQVSAILMYINMFPGLIPQLYSLPLCHCCRNGHSAGSRDGNEIWDLRSPKTTWVKHIKQWYSVTWKCCKTMLYLIRFYCYQNLSRLPLGRPSPFKVSLSKSNSFWTYKQHAMTTWTGHMTRHQSVSTRELCFSLSP